MPSIILDRY